MRRWSDAIINGLIIGVVQAVVLILLLLAVTAALGNQQTVGAKYQQATACELAIPSDPQKGRDPVLVAQCFLNLGLPAPDFVGDRS